MRSKDPMFLFALAAIALVGILVLLGLARPVPQDLWTLAGIVIGGIVGVARQDGTNPVQNVTIPGAIAPNINGSSTTTTAEPAPVESLAGPDVAA
jgi:hypothetical protein